MNKQKHLLIIALKKIQKEKQREEDFSTITLDPGFVSKEQGFIFQKALPMLGKRYGWKTVSKFLDDMMKKEDKEWVGGLGYVNKNQERESTSFYSNGGFAIKAETKYTKDGPVTVPKKKIFGSNPKMFVDDPQDNDMVDVWDAAKNLQKNHDF